MSLPSPNIIDRDSRNVLWPEGSSPGRIANVVVSDSIAPQFARGIESLVSAMSPGDDRLSLVLDVTVEKKADGEPRFELSWKTYSYPAGYSSASATPEDALSSLADLFAARVASLERELASKRAALKRLLPPSLEPGDTPF